MSTSKTSPFDFDVSAWGKLPKLRGLFVTGTDTDVGKTMIAGAIARHLRRTGRRVEVLKPAASGCRRDRGQLVSADAEFLAACADSRRTLAEIAPLRMAPPLAPNVAARREGREIDLEDLFDTYRRLARQSDVDAVIVEGVGGLLCPIRDDFWVIHLAKMMALPLVIVARPGLGTINHTLLTLSAARRAGLRVAGVVVNRYRTDSADVDPAVQTNPAEIADRGGVNVLALVPNDPRSSVEKATIGNDVQFTIDQVDWRGLIGL
jgi:dethiobiotin synthetase